MSASSRAALSVAGVLEQAASLHGERPFLEVLPEVAELYGVRPGPRSFAALRTASGELARAYAAAGYGAGHRLGLLLENRPQFFEHWFALNALGASIVPLNADWRSAELEYVIGHAELAAIVAPRERFEALRHAAKAHPLEFIDASTPQPRAAPAEPPLGAAEPGLQSEAALLYTSGTTGRPKGCVLANEYFLMAGEWYAAAGGYCRLHRGAERMLTPLPLTHMNALAYSAMAMLGTGGCLVLLDRFHPRTWWSSVRAARATIVHYLGVMPAMLLAQPPDSLERTHEVRFGFGAGVLPAHHAPFERRFGFPLIEAWAMTETGAGAVIAATHEPRDVGTRCFGRAPDTLDWRVVDDAGCDTPRGTVGELWVRHRGEAPRRGFFTEYLKDPDATAAAWEQGYFHTGDLVTVDAAGAFRFVDRKKNVIRRSGENIAAIEVETVLQEHPSVRAAAVTAVPDPVRGEEVAACIVLRSSLGDGEAPAAARALVEHCLGRLAYYKAPGYVHFVDALPLTPTEKVQRPALKAVAAAALEQGRALDLRALKRRDRS